MRNIIGMRFLESKKFLVGVVVFGLIGVILSYYLGMKGVEGGLSALWGNMPERYRPLYFITGGLAFVGYGIAFSFLMFKTDLFNYYPFSRSMIVVLVASMLWLPYTAEMINEPSDFTWVKVRIALLLVGLGAWFFMRRVWLCSGEGHGTWHKVAIAGAMIFFFHTMVMDAILWPMWFK